MRIYKILALGFLFFFFFSITFSFDESIKIIPRSEWGANEEYRYLDSKEWKDLLKKQEEVATTPLTNAQKATQEKAAKREKEINSYLSENYTLENTVVEKVTTENGRPLAWPIQKTSTVKGIVIHHTETETKTSLEGIQSIYKFHSLTRGWGDIGYNYVIGYDGEIYEGRAGGDYVVGAHALYNNRSTIGISLMGNMENHEITEEQLLSLQKLILFVSKKYGIDLSKKIDFHKECKGEKCSAPIASFSSYPIVGHKDVGLTACPGKFLYSQLETLITYLTPDTKGLVAIKNKTISKVLATTQKPSLTPVSSVSTVSENVKSQSTEKLLTLLGKVEYSIDISTTLEKKKALEKIKLNIQKELKTRLTVKQKTVKNSFEDTKYIKVRLSYPGTGSIVVTNGSKKYTIEKSGTGVLVGGKTFKKIAKISSGSGGFLTIASWQRIPEWDTKKQYNDNTFRGNLIVYVENDTLIVVNEVKLSDYLAGLGEVSEGTNNEKAKTIIISARTYARYYMEKERKFPGEWYDATDNPDEFQRYLGYGFEKRSPGLKKLVQETKNYYITYKGSLIKPWYFSSSNGKTLSFLQYCVQGGTKETVCKESAKKYPYLQSVDDYGALGKTRLGHGVGVSGIGSSYFAERGWTAEMIIQYYLKTTNIQLL